MALKISKPLLAFTTFSEQKLSGILSTFLLIPTKACSFICVNVSGLELFFWDIMNTDGLVGIINKMSFY